MTLSGGSQSILKLSAVQPCHTSRFFFIMLHSAIGKKTPVVTEKETSIFRAIKVTEFSTLTAVII